MSCPPPRGRRRGERGGLGAPGGAPGLAACCGPLFRERVGTVPGCGQRACAPNRATAPPWSPSPLISGDICPSGVGLCSFIFGGVCGDRLSSSHLFPSCLDHVGHTVGAEGTPAEVYVCFSPGQTGTRSGHFSKPVSSMANGLNDNNSNNCPKRPVLWQLCWGRAAGLLTSHVPAAAMGPCQREAAPLPQGPGPWGAVPGGALWLQASTRACPELALAAPLCRGALTRGEPHLCAWGPVDKCTSLHTLQWDNSEVHPAISQRTPSPTVEGTISLAHPPAPCCSLVPSLSFLG